MKAIRIHKTGDVSVLQIDDIECPTPAPGQILVKIKATGLNRMDLWVRQGIPGMGELPLILGCDGSGEVSACGAGVSSFKVGDRVSVFPMFSYGQGADEHSERFYLKPDFQIYGEHVNGTHVEFFCTDEKHLLRIPDELTYQQAAAFPLVFLTAWQMLVRKASLQKGQDVLIVGASSGVGSAAIQIAKFAGARVIATVGDDIKANQAKELGADDVILHHDQSIAKTVKELTGKKGVEVIFEHVGQTVWAECLKCLAWGGRLVTCGATTGPQVSFDLRHIFIKQQQILGSTMGTFTDMQEILKLVTDGTFKPVVGKVFDYTEVRAAHQHLEGFGGFGKVILNWEV